MNVRPEFELPPEKQALRHRAIKLEWITLLVFTINIAVLSLVLGNSQAMRTAWIEDIVTLIPPLAFLVATHFEMKSPSYKNPYGYFRAIDIAYGCSSLALLVFGLILLYEGIHTLIKGTHPSIGTLVVFGHQVWLGWLMISALIFTAIPPVIVGRLKLSVARKLHDKALYADADMNKADWLTGIAGVIGVGGIGLGYWWLDAVAAIIISVDILWDGIRNLKRVTLDILDTVPREVDSDREVALLDTVAQTLKKMHWVDDVQVRMREEGHVFSGEATVIPKGINDANDLMRHLQKARKEVLDLDWRLYDFSLIPMRPDNADGGGQGPRGAGDPQ